MTVVADASPLIALARIRAFDLLPALFVIVVIPPAVYHEVVTRGRGRPGDPEVRAGIDAGFIERRAPQALVEAPHGGLHRGEIEAISLAKELGADLLLDELPARRRAEREGVFCRGTLDVLLLAKGAGLIDAIRPHLDALQGAEFRIDDDLRTAFLLQARES